MIKAGDMRELIEIQESTSTVNEFGEAVISWCTKVQTHAKIDQLSFAQLIRAEKAESQKSWNVQTRWIPGLEEPLRLIWINNKCRVLYVSSVVADDAKRTSISFTCEERE